MKKGQRLKDGRRWEEEVVELGKLLLAPGQRFGIWGYDRFHEANNSL